VAFFPDTPQELIASLAEVDAAEENERWARFVELYEPAVREFIRLQDPDMPSVDADDIVQETMVRLVPTLRNGAFDPKKGKFRTYLSVIVKRLMIDRARARAARPLSSSVPIGDCEPAAETPTAAALLDMKWRLARHHAAIEFVFTKSSLSQQSREVYLLGEVEGLKMKDVAAKLNLAPNAVRRIASRVRKMIAAVEGELM